MGVPMTSPSPAPPFTRAEAVNTAEPLRQARQMERIDPLAPIRPVDPEGAARAARGPAPRGSP